MATIQNIPEEIVSMIFKHLHMFDLRECQQVCRAWYYPAHVLFLKTIRIVSSASKLQKFISSIDHNPNHKYLNAVKNIEIFNLHRFPFTEDTIFKLLGRFPNLTNVTFRECDTLLDQFNDEMCKDLLEKCPKLTQFDVIGCSIRDQDCFDLLYGARLLVTTIDFYYYCGIQPLDETTLVPYLADFPRLQKIVGVNDGFHRFDQLFQLLQQSSNLKDISMTIGYVQENDDEDDDDEEEEENPCHLMESYLATDGRSEQNLLVSRLSNITKFTIQCPSNISMNTAEFVIKYLTGLEDFRMDVDVDGDSLSYQEQLVILDVFHEAKNTGKVRLAAVNLQDCSRYLSTIHDKALCSTSTLKFKAMFGIPELAFIDVETRPSGEIVVVEICEHPLYEMASTILNGVPPMHNIQTLEMEPFESVRTNSELNSNTFYEILGKLPMLRKLALKIPGTYREVQENDKMYPLVEEIKIQPGSQVKLQGILDRFTVMFPNCKYLDLHSFGWLEDPKEFSVDLSNYSLQKLTMNIAPIKSIIYRHLKESEDFYLVELNLSENRQEYLYKLPLDSFIAKRINESDLEGYKDYIRIKITVDNLQRLVIYNYSNIFGLFSIEVETFLIKHPNYFVTNSIPHTTLFCSNW